MAKKNFLDEDLEAEPKLGYVDGFRFGFGMFVAWLVGSLLVGGLAAIIARFLHFR